MPKGYWIGRVDISDEESYKKYIKANGPVFAKYGGKFLVRGGRSKTVEGASRARNVVIEFADFETASACWHSPEYQAAMKLRTDVSVADMLVIEGYDGPQPSTAA